MSISYYTTLVLYKKENVSTFILKRGMSCVKMISLLAMLQMGTTIGVYNIYTHCNNSILNSESSTFLFCVIPLSISLAEYKLQSGPHVMYLQLICDSSQVYHIRHTSIFLDEGNFKFYWQRKIYISSHHTDCVVNAVFGRIIWCLLYCCRWAAFLKAQG